MPTSKNETALAESLDTVKPIVKDFVDPDKTYVDYLSLHLPHVPHSTMRCHQVYQSKNRTVRRFRINYWVKINHEDSLISTGQIVKSLYVEVRETLDGYHLTQINGQN